MFLEVRVEPAAGNGVVRSAHVVLEVPEEPFDGVGVDVPGDVDALGVVDAAVEVPVLGDAAVGLVQRAADFSLALIDLGAMICRPRRPRCYECPLRLRCTAFAAGGVIPADTS